MLHIANPIRSRQAVTSRVSSTPASSYCLIICPISLAFSRLQHSSTSLLRNSTTRRNRPLRLLELRTAVGISTTNVASNENTSKGDNYVEDDEEVNPPPLPTWAHELFSNVLTGMETSRSEDTLNGAAGFLDASTGASSASYQPLRFCVNCCRPLPRSSDVCSGCAHNPRRNAEVLGHPTLWVEAYAAQLHQQGQDEQQQQQGPALEAASVTTARSFQPVGDVLLAADARTLLHRSSLPPYPGRPERLQAIMSKLHSAGLLERCRLLACRPATDPELLAVHSPNLVSSLRRMDIHHHISRQDHSQEIHSQNSSSSNGQASNLVVPSVSSHGLKTLCPDTLYNAHTCTSALLAAGAAADLGTALATGRVRGALAVMRPPGAQAGMDVARGGCYLNNVAVAAAAALSSGLQRIMILDWDVHHGRGTQEIFLEDPRVMVVSMHRYDSETYPGSGSVEEVGEGSGEGTNLNIAFGRAGKDENGRNNVGLMDGDLLSAMLHVVLPVAYQFRPQLVLVAAGFGALRGDPIGACSCSPAVFAHLTHLLSGLAPRGLGLLLEGGYNLAVTASAVEGCLRVLLGEAPPPLPGPWATTAEGWVAIMNAMQIHSQYWSALHPLSFRGWTAAIADQQRRLEEQQRQEEEEEEEHEAEELRELQRLAQEQQEEEGKQREARWAHHYSQGSASGGAGVVAEVAALAGRNGKVGRDKSSGIGALQDDNTNDDDGLSAAELARVAATLKQARDSWLSAHGDSIDNDMAGKDELTTLLQEEVAAELHDPRDIDPAALLDVFLGTGSSHDYVEDQ